MKDKSLVNAEKICGLRSTAKIVGGKDTKPNAWIWMVCFFVFLPSGDWRIAVQ